MQLYILKYQRSHVHNVFIWRINQKLYYLLQNLDVYLLKEVIPRQDVSIVFHYQSALLYSTLVPIKKVLCNTQVSFLKKQKLINSCYCLFCRFEKVFERLKSKETARLHKQTKTVISMTNFEMGKNNCGIVESSRQLIILLQLFLSHSGLL